MPDHVHLILFPAVEHVQEVANRPSGIGLE